MTHEDGKDEAAAEDVEKLRIKVEAYASMAADANATLGGIARNERLREAAARVVRERDELRSTAEQYIKKRLSPEDQQAFAALVNVCDRQRAALEGKAVS